MPVLVQTEATERRRHRRQVIGQELISVDVAPDNTFGLIFSLCENGAAIQTIASLEAGGMKTLRWRLPPDDALMEVKAEVVWSRDRMSGVRFVRVADDVRLRIARWLKAFAKSAEASQCQETEAVVGKGVPSLESELDVLAGIAASLLHADGVAIAMASGGRFVCRASQGAAPGVGVELELHHSLSGESVRTAAPTCCADAYRDPRVDADACRELNVRSVVAVPVKQAGAVIGIIECLWRRPRAHADRDVEQVAAIAERIAALVEAYGPAAASSASMRQAESRSESQFNRPPIPRTPDSPAAQVSEEAVATAALQRLRMESSKVEAPAPATASRSALRWAIVAVLVLATIASGAGAWYLLRPKFAPAPAETPNATKPQPKKAQSSSKAAVRRPGSSPSRNLQPQPPTAVVGAVSNASVPPERDSGKTADYGNAGRTGASAPEREAPKVTPAVLQPAVPLPITPNSGGTRAQARITRGWVSLPAFESVEHNRTPAKLISKVQPTFPTTQARLDGAVVLRVTVTKDGAAKVTQVVQGSPALVEAVKEAVMRWRYQPATIDGNPVEDYILVSVNFSRYNVR